MGPAINSAAFTFPVTSTRKTATIAVITTTL
jgi:hypothetical protein